VLGALCWAASQLDPPTLADGSYDGAGIGVHTLVRRLLQAASLSGGGVAAMAGVGGRRFADSTAEQRAVEGLQAGRPRANARDALPGAWSRRSLWFERVRRCRGRYGPRPWRDRAVAVLTPCGIV